MEANSAHGYTDNELITIFQTEHYTFYGRDLEGNSINRWVKQLAFFFGDLSAVDVKLDWRFKSVGNMRKESVLIGTISAVFLFPVVYPIKTIEGRVIESGEYEPLKYEVEGDYNDTI